MQVSINVEDDLYNEAVNSGIDMQSKFNEYLTSVLNNKHFTEDKKYFQDTYSDIKSGKAEMISHDEVWEKIDKHTQDF